LSSGEAIYLHLAAAAADFPLVLREFTIGAAHVITLGAAQIQFSSHASHSTIVAGPSPGVFVFARHVECEDGNAT
jgi:hypothetical protein